MAYFDEKFCFTWYLDMGMTSVKTLYPLNIKVKGQIWWRRLWIICETYLNSTLSKIT